jgi:hypothetical protein
MGPVSIRYQVFLMTLDGETPWEYDEKGAYVSPDIPTDRLDDQLTPEGAVISAQQWFDQEGWTNVSIPNENRGHGYATSPSGRVYRTQLHEMRCATYGLKYLGEGH